MSSAENRLGRKRPPEGTGNVELLSASMDATNAGDFDAGLSVFAADATFDASSAGLDVFRGVAAIRSYFEDWVGAYEQQRFSEWEGEDLGGGVVLALATFESRLPGSSVSVTERRAFVCRFCEGSICSVTADGDFDRARAQAARLAAQASGGNSSQRRGGPGLQKPTHGD